MIKKIKNGYTFTEVLVVVAIISIIMLLVFPNLPKSYASVAPRAYENKKGVILEVAKLYASDNSELFKGSTSTIQIEIEDLIKNNYINPDITKNNDNCDSEYGCIINPDTKKSLNKYLIIITKKGTMYETSMMEN